MHEVRVKDFTVRSGEEAIFGRLYVPAEGENLPAVIISHGYNGRQLVTYISADERAEKVMENQSVIRHPIVRNGRKATVGYAPDIWKTWQ